MNVGVTGHRILTDEDNINSGIEEALSRIEKNFAGQPLVVLSALAEGADRLVAHRVLARAGARLIAPLPLAKDDYIKDFDTVESRLEFLLLLGLADEIIEMPPARTRDEAYELAGSYILDNSDVLIAVWDGCGAQGQGGTGEIVACARERGLPIVWIHAGNRKPGTHEPTSLGDEQGKVTFENF